MWNNVPDVDFSILPEGKYKVAVIEVNKRESKAGHDYLRLKIEVKDERYPGKFVYDNVMWHTDGCAKRAKYVFKKIGCEKAIKENRLPTERELCTGGVFVLDIVHEKNNGRTWAVPNGFGYYKLAEAPKEETKEKDPFEADNQEWDGGEPPF